MQIGPNIKAVQSVKAQAQAAGTVNGVAVDAADFDEATIIFDAGTVGASGTIDVKVQEATDSAFTTPVDITGAAFTQVDATNDDQTFLGVVQLEPGRLQFLRAVSVVAVATSPLSVVIVLAKARTKPANTPSFNV